MRLAFSTFSALSQSFSALAHWLMKTTLSQCAGEQWSDLAEAGDDQHLTHGLIRRAATRTDMQRGRQREGGADPDAGDAQPDRCDDRVLGEQQDR